MPSRVFLLSPANCRGRRAGQLLAPRSTVDVASRLRSEAGVAIGDLFAYLSALYFRGKLAYARTFAKAPADAGSGVLVITADRGLVPAETTVGLETLRQFASADISLDNARYCEPLERSARALTATIGEDGEVVLLGSIASEKYVRVLSGVFGMRLIFPAAFVGRGDMSRGGLLLRAAAAGAELEYIPVIGAVRRGTRPPRLGRRT
jgi:hypothetical protein